MKSFGSPMIGKQESVHAAEHNPRFARIVGKRELRNPMEVRQGTRKVHLSRFSFVAN